MASEELLAHFDLESQDVADELLEEEATEEAVEETVAEEQQEEDADSAVETAEATEEPAQHLYAGKYKTPEELERAYTEGLRDLQQTKDREVAEAKARAEAYESILNNPLPEQPQQQEPVSTEQIDEGVETAPIDTFQWAMHNQPDAVPYIIGKMREKGDHVTAEQMSMTYTNALNMAQQQQMMAEYQKAMEPQMVQQSIDRALNIVAEHYGDDFKNLSNEVSVKLKEMGNLPSWDVQTLTSAIEYSFLQAYRERAMKVAQEGSAPAPTPQAFTEAGTPGQEPDDTPDDALRNEILGAWQSGYGR